MPSARQPRPTAALRLRASAVLAATLLSLPACASQTPLLAADGHGNYVFGTVLRSYERGGAADARLTRRTGSFCGGEDRFALRVLYGPPGETPPLAYEAQPSRNNFRDDIVEYGIVGCRGGAPGGDLRQLGHVRRPGPGWEHRSRRAVGKCYALVGALAPDATLKVRAPRLVRSWEGALGVFHPPEFPSFAAFEGRSFLSVFGCPATPSKLGLKVGWREAGGKGGYQLFVYSRAATAKEHRPRPADEREVGPSPASVTPRLRRCSPSSSRSPRCRSSSPSTRTWRPWHPGGTGRARGSSGSGCARPACRAPAHASTRRRS